MTASKLQHLDAVAHEMEIKWGVDRLPTLVDADLAAKFTAQAKLVDDAIAGGRREEIELRAEGMIRAWQALDTVAEARGALPMFKLVWDGRLSDGRRVALVREDSGYMAGKHASGADLVFTFPEVLRLIEGMPEMLLEAKMKLGGTVTGVSDKPPLDFAVGDEVPF